MEDDKFKMEEVLPDVFDTGNGTAFIWAKKTSQPWGAVKCIVKNKEAWQKKFPNKKIITMCDLNYDTFTSEIYAYTLTMGILIHYEYVK